MSNYAKNTTAANDVFANALYVIVAVAIGTWLIWDVAFHRLATYPLFSDYWQHTAVLKEWLTNFANPGNPHVADPSLSPLFMPYYWALTFYGLLFQLDAIDLMGYSALINYALIVVGLRMFAADYFQDSWAPLAAFFAIFMLWGLSWNWANLYQLRSFFFVAAYPSSFVFGLSLISFSTITRFLRADSSKLMQVLLLPVLAALMFLCHPPTAVFGLTGCALLALTEPANSSQRRFAAIFLLLLGTAVAELWPYFSPWKSILGMYGSGVGQSGGESLGAIERLTSGAWQHIFYSPKLILVMLGPALLGIPLLVWLWRRRERMFIIWGVILMSVPYVTNLFVEIPFAHQFLLFAAFYLQLAVVCGVLEVIGAWRTVPRPASAGPALGAIAACMIGLTGFNVWLLSIEFDGYTVDPKTREVVYRRGNLPEDMSVVDIYTLLTERLPADSVVLTTAELGWPLPTFGGKVVSLYHANPMLLDQAERYKDTGDFFFKRIKESRRSAIVEGYGATHVLTASANQRVEPALENWLAEHALPTASVAHYQMYRLKPSAVAAAQAPATAPASALIETPDEPLPAQPGQLEVTLDSGADYSVAVPEMPQDSGQPKPSPAGDFGAPIAEPIIEPVAEAPVRDAGSTVSEELPADLLAPIEDRTDTSDAQPDVQPPETFGAPIANPVLDPERHGG